MMTPLVLLALWVLAQAPAPAAPAVDLLHDVGRLASSTTNEERFEALTAMLEARKLAFTVEPFTIEKPVGTEPRTEGRNVVVTLGRGPGGIVVGGHYDAARLADGSLSGGAVDNAASSVILVRLAEALQSEPLPLPVRIVWFDMEELGLLGSAAFVRQHGAEGIAGMLNFDINGYGSTILYGPSDRADNRALRRTLVATCAAQDVSCMAFPQMPPSDDRPFTGANIPTLSIAVLPPVEAHQVWLLVNGGPNSGLSKEGGPAIMRTIHSPADRPDKVVEDAMGRMLRFAQALVRAVVAP